MKNITGNWWFMAVLLFEFNVQYLLVGYTGLGYVFTTTPLTLSMHLTALGFGVGSLVVGALAKLLPPGWTDKLPRLKDDESDSPLQKRIQRIQKQINSNDQ
ncbi:MAG: cation transporting ATPase C-terminal domain-containing protein [bacterium]